LRRCSRSSRSRTWRRAGASWRAAERRFWDAVRVLDAQGLGGGLPSAPDAASGSASETFWERLADDEREGLLALGTRHSFPEDSALMLQGERDDRLMLLLAGRVKVTSSAGAEHELLLAIRDTGELLGELS